MKPTIIVIDRLHHHKELKTLRNLLAKMQKKFEYGKASIFPNDIVKDFICLIEMPDLKVGLFESDSQQHAYSLQLDFFSNKSCDLIFCNCPRNGKFIEYLYSLHEAKRIDLIHVKNIWFDSISSELLEEFQVDKLFEMIQLKIESKFEFNFQSQKYRGTIAG